MPSRNRANWGCTGKPATRPNSNSLTPHHNPSPTFATATTPFKPTSDRARRALAQTVWTLQHVEAADPCTLRGRQGSGGARGGGKPHAESVGRPFRRQLALADGFVPAAMILLLFRDAHAGVRFSVRGFHVLRTARRHRPPSHSLPGGGGLLLVSHSLFPISACSACGVGGDSGDARRHEQEQ